jgi:hypothetical protein
VSDVSRERLAGTRHRIDVGAKRTSQAAGRSEPVGALLDLEVTLVNGQNFSIPIEHGHSVESELDLFLKREGRYADEWVPLQKAGRELFVRYEQIVLVSPKSD